MATVNSNTAQKKTLNLNIGMVIFAAIAIEICVAVFSFLNTKHISPYEVREGSLYTNHIYTGIALRNEAIYYGSEAGYVNYYIREGSHASVGDLIYTVDETGSLIKKENNSGEMTLSEGDLGKIRNELSNYSIAFEKAEFSTVYSFKNHINSKIVELANFDTLTSVEQIGNNNSNLIHYHYIDKPGVVVYNIDGYEDYVLEDMNKDLFDQDQYETKLMSNDNLIESGDLVFKLSTNESWALAIQVDEETAKLLDEKEYVEVKFLKNQYTSWAACTSFQNADGDWFEELRFNNSMITFASDRFVNVELLLDNETGLKIPNSSIAKKEFFIVPKEYITKGGSKGRQGVLRVAFDDENNEITEFIETSIYSETDQGEYYLDDSQLRMNDELVKLDSTDRFIIKRTGELDGVYNINKGYAEFREITVLYQNEEYAIVKPNTTYGLSVYDYIVLDATTVADNDLIYE